MFATDGYRLAQIGDGVQSTKETLFEALGLVKVMAREGEVKKSRGALFVEIMKRRTGGSDGVQS